MIEYQNLLMMLKVYNHNVQILHRHLVGENWFGNHAVLGDYYEKLQDDIDELAELGLAIEIDEPTIQQSLVKYKELEIKNRDSEESFIIVRGYFNDIVAQINRINGLSNDVTNKLQEKQEYYRVEADFKLFRATMTDIED